MKKVLITSALPYVNNVPHLGNIVGSVLSADVYARFCRLRGYDTLYIGGTDEYGTATETAAIKEGTSPREICDKYHEIHKEVYEWFEISFDKFGRTTNEKHEKIVQHVFEKCFENGFISESSLDQLYCQNCNKFLADRFVEGTCPKCNHLGARGDQCDNCSALYDAIELIDPVCQQPKCGYRPIVASSNHFFIDLPKLEKEIKEWHDKWVENEHSNQVVSITKSWIKRGLEKKCITRDLKWGIPVPGMDKVFYVWFDAPIGYISITADHIENWKDWWQNKNVEYYQFMGKDNVPFHSIIFPASLIGSKTEWTMVKGISCTSYLTYEGEKFSKSKNNGVFGNQIKDLGLPSYVFRYYLLSIRPENGDADFKWKELVTKNNNELMANFGNFINRILKFCQKHYTSVPPKSIGYETDIQSWEALIQEYIKLLEKRELKTALQTIFHLSSLCNKFWQHQKPWTHLHTDKCDTITNLCLTLISVLATLIEPFLPSLSVKICKQLNTNLKALLFPTFSSFCIKPGHVLGPCEPLIEKIPESRLTEFYEKFGSN